MQNMRHPVILTGIVLFLVVHAFAAVPDACEAPNVEITSLSLTKRACELIYQSKFDAAGKLIEKHCKDIKSQPPILSELAQTIQEYQAICQQRQSAREDAYIERLAELEKLSTKTDSNDVNDISSVSDVNNITEALLVIAKACELADEQQKEELLSKPYVKQTIQKAINKAAEYESEGKWLDAYITCYSWLQAIETNNEAYTKYAEHLVEKASIVASFLNSPCETRKERFQGVNEEMFVWAIDFLKTNYIDIIDYKQMITNAIKRCKLLGEVVSLSYPDLSKSLTGVSSSVPELPQKQPEELQESFPAPDSRKLAAWSAALSAVLGEVEQSPTGFGEEDFIDVFKKVLALNETTVDLPRQVLIAQFAEASLSTLDPYTVIVWPKQVRDFQKMMTNEFTGIGIEITKQKGLLTVASLLPDTPAYNSGLDAEDVIEKVDGIETKDMTLICAVHKITGPKGTKVTLTIRHAGEEETRDITITRARITVPTLRGWQRTKAGRWRYMIDDEEKIGYVRITSFSERTPADLEKVLNKLEEEGLKGLILDLRFNSGGLLDSAIEVTDKFLKEGLIVRTERGFGRGLVFEAAHEENTHPNYPLVILINSSSASASEIVAGALEDEKHNRAILVGKRTHGKGSVQGIVYYPGEGAQLKYTMAYYHLPSGQRVESQEAMKKRGRKDWGIGPNIEVELRSDELKKMIEVQRNNDVLVKTGTNSSKHEFTKHTIKETLATDPQLAVGVLVIKSKLVEAKAQASAAKLQRTQSSRSAELKSARAG